MTEFPTYRLTSPEASSFFYAFQYASTDAFLALLGIFRDISKANVLLKTMLDQGSASKISTHPY